MCWLQQPGHRGRARADRPQRSAVRRRGGLSDRPVTCGRCAGPKATFEPAGERSRYAPPLARPAPRAPRPAFTLKVAAARGPWSLHRPCAMAASVSLRDSQVCGGPVPSGRATPGRPGGAGSDLRATPGQAGVRAHPAERHGPWAPEGTKGPSCEAPRKSSTAHQGHADGPGTP